MTAIVGAYFLYICKSMLLLVKHTFCVSKQLSKYRPIPSHLFVGRGKRQWLEVTRDIRNCSELLRGLIVRVRFRVIRRDKCSVRIKVKISG